MRNGFKVGPNTVPTAVAESWIDVGSVVRTDPVRQRPGGRVSTTRCSTTWCTWPSAKPLLQVAGLRILEARAWIAVGSLFPQSQAAFGDYTRTGAQEHRVEDDPEPIL